MFFFKTISINQDDACVVQASKEYDEIKTGKLPEKKRKLFYLFKYR